MNLNQPNENTTHETEQSIELKKTWQAPQLNKVSIAGLTEHMSTFGNDGFGTFSFS
jgi:hypothetical protein